MEKATYVFRIYENRGSGHSKEYLAELSPERSMYLFEHKAPVLEELVELETSLDCPLQLGIMQVGVSGSAGRSELVLDVPQSVLDVEDLERKVYRGRGQLGNLPRVRFRPL